VSPHTHITEKSSGRPAAPYTTCDLEEWESYVVTKRLGVVVKKGNYAAPGADWLTCESHLIRRRNLRRKSYNDGVRKEKNRGLLPEYHDFKPLALNTFYPYEKNGAVVREREPWLGEVVPRAITHTIVESGSTSAKGFIPDKQRERLPKTTDDLKPTEYKAVKPKIRKTSRRREKTPRSKPKPLPRPAAPVVESHVALAREWHRWSAYWDEWDQLMGTWWGRLAEEEPQVVGMDLHQALREARGSAWARFARTRRDRESVALLVGTLEVFALAFKEEGNAPDAEGWDRIVVRTLNSLAGTQAEAHLKASRGRSMSSIVHATRSTKTHPSNRLAYQRRDGTKLPIIASYLPLATMEAAEHEDDLLGRSERGVGARARRGVSLKQVKFEDRQERLDKVVGEGPATVGELEPDPGAADPAHAYAKKMEREAQRNFVRYINTVAMVTLKKRQKEVWVALYINRDKRPHGKIAAEMGISKSAFSKTRGRALENVRGALAARGIEGRIDGWAEKWWLEGPRVLNPETGRPMPAFHSQRRAA
jgi:DNA-directed RNA polymerase specialized sigma24 family protein